MRKFFVSILLAGLVLSPAIQVSASAVHGGGGAGAMSHLLGIARISPQAGSKVNGAAFLQYNPKEGKIDVVLLVSGLAPNTVHPVHIHMGSSCAANGPVIYPLPTLTANGAGVAIAGVAINAQQIPATGWYVNVHQGPGLQGAQFTPIGCGIVQRAEAAAGLNPQAGTNVQGLAVFVRNASTTTVAVLADNLTPGSSHPEHIHLGSSCAANGPVIYPLPTLTADEHGIAVSVTAIPTTIVPATGWYINIHRGPGLQGAQFTPISCGIVSRAM